jgi:hypothetical protein
VADLKPELRNQIKTIIDGELHQYDIETLDIKIAEDASGDEAIFVDVRYLLSQREFDPKQMNKVRSAVRSMLVDNNELRFPYIRHHLQDGQKVRAA